MERLGRIFTWPVIILACATIGLAPFAPEPHIWKDLKWVIAGAEGMQLKNWADLLFHGLPWILFLMKTTATFKKG